MKHPLQKDIDAALEEVLEEVKKGVITVETIKRRLAISRMRTEIYRRALTRIERQHQEWRRHPVKTRVALAISLTGAFVVFDLIFSVPFPFVIYEALVIGFYTWRPEYIMDLLPRERK